MSHKWDYFLVILGYVSDIFISVPNEPNVYLNFYVAYTLHICIYNVALIIIVQLLHLYIGNLDTHCTIQQAFM